MSFLKEDFEKAHAALNRPDALQDNLSKAILNPELMNFVRQDVLQAGRELTYYANRHLIRQADARDEVYRVTPFVMPRGTPSQVKDRWEPESHFYIRTHNTILGSLSRNLPDVDLVNMQGYEYKSALIDHAWDRARSDLRSEIIASGHDVEKILLPYPTEEHQEDLVELVEFEIQKPEDWGNIVRRAWTVEP